MTFLNNNSIGKHDGSHLFSFCFTESLGFCYYCSLDFDDRVALSDNNKVVWNYYN